MHKDPHAKSISINKRKLSYLKEALSHSQFDQSYRLAQLASQNTKWSDHLTCDATFCSGGGASTFLRSWKVLAGCGERVVSRMTWPVAAGRGAVGRGGRLVAAVGGVAVARLRARARAGRADVGYHASWWQRGKWAMKTRTAATLCRHVDSFHFLPLKHKAGDTIFYLLSTNPMKRPKPTMNGS